MADYGVTARFDPFTMEEMIRPYELMFKYSDLLEKKREQKEAERQDLLDKLSIQDASLKAIADKFPDSGASTAYNELSQRMRNISDAIASGTFSDSMKKEARLLNRDYTTISAPYVEAYNTWKTKAAELNAAALKNPNTIFDIDYRNATIGDLTAIDYLMLNPSGSYQSINLDAVEADAAKDYYNGVWNRESPDKTTAKILSKYQNLPESMLSLILQAVINGLVAGVAAYKEKNRTTRSGSGLRTTPKTGTFKIGDQVVTYNITPYGATIKDINNKNVVFNPGNDIPEVAYNKTYFDVDDYYSNSTGKWIGVRKDDNTDNYSLLVLFNPKAGKINKEISLPRENKEYSVIYTLNSAPNNTMDNSDLNQLIDLGVLDPDVNDEDLNILANEGIITKQVTSVGKKKYEIKYIVSTDNVLQKLDTEQTKRNEYIKLLLATSLEQAQLKENNPLDE